MDDEGFQVEAVFPCARISKIDPKRPYEVWRVDGVTPRQRNGLLIWAYNHLGEWYGLLYVLSFTLIKPKGEEVCCTFVRDAYRSQGIYFHGSRPDEIAESGKASMIFSKGER